MKTLSIVIPVFNEVRTIAQVLERVRKASSSGLEKELVVVDDGSTDGTREYLAGLREPDTRCMSGTGARARPCAPASLTPRETC